ncbi:MAG: DUF559 domain-containing protein [Ignavibacteria bacterium]|nr:DUF559 domain-containing protein [Ignavibacteria bacterium]
MKIRYKPRLRLFARKLRNDPTLAESILWKLLRKKKVNGYIFLRQRPIHSYIVDFFCYKLNLIIELDGESHIGREEKDLKRQLELESMGYKVIRFKNEEVLCNCAAVINRIEEVISELNPPPPFR